MVQGAFEDLPDLGWTGMRLKEKRAHGDSAELFSILRVLTPFDIEGTDGLFYSFREDRIILDPKNTTRRFAVIYGNGTSPGVFQNLCK